MFGRRRIFQHRQIDKEERLADKTNHSTGKMGPQRVACLLIMRMWRVFFVVLCVSFSWKLGAAK